MNVMMIYWLGFLLLFTGVTEKKDSEKADKYDTAYSQFKKHLESNEYVKAYESIHKVMEMLLEKTPFTLNNVRFVESENTSYGMYEPKENNVFRSGEPIYLYMEPIGNKFIKSQEGYYDFGFIADFTLEDTEGNILGGQKKFANLRYKTWHFNTEIALTFTYTFTGFSKGKYKVTTTVKDAFSDGEVTLENWFYIE